MKDKGETGYRRLVAEAVLRRLAALSSHSRAVRLRRGTDPVHDMRVASRRVRAALRLLKGHAPARRLRKWDRQIKRVTSALGQARDTDVQMDVVRRCLSRAPAKCCRPGLTRLLLRLRQRRDALQEEVRAALDRFDASGAAAQMNRELQSAGTLTDASFAFTYKAALKEISNRLDRLLKYERHVPHPERVKQLHRMRIAAKRLRYALEIFDPAYEGRLDPWIRAARRIQTDLGEIHDCDVWAQELPKFLEEEAQRGRLTIADLKPGIDHLRRDRLRQRRALYREFRRHWSRLRAKRVWEGLIALLKARKHSSADRETDA